MRVINAELRRHFQGPGKCGLCNKECRSRECAHYLARGMGAGGILDVTFNLIALGGAFGCNCHGRQHNGQVHPADLLAMISGREFMMKDDVLTRLERFRRAPKNANVCPACKGKGTSSWPLFLDCLECDMAGVLYFGTPWRKRGQL